MSGREDRAGGDHAGGLERPGSHSLESNHKSGGVPRLKARFPDHSQTHVALLKAIRDADDGVRCAAISAVADLRLSAAADLLVEALSDPERDVRFFAAVGLQTLGDPRAPVDPERFAYESND